ncbi:YkgJ family cysteine cluster protein [Nonomuraea turcica]|uniref:YkgJ family cysteine cluster protein n=1 Tax=Nonomuraea sp. G32 TaxID=3067274 RepID=UPI00273CD46E|nr:YkgJ family cysteine cluster protein [Nonomuraea sp. G32]MDP4501036.1 YkgJ family cysteine cluster protein [Nonomuraea sp. G32]
MSRWSEAIEAHLEALYVQVPDVGCKGLCQEACGPIDMHPYERARIRRAGVTIPRPAEALERILAGEDYTCPALVDGRCSVYEIRPLICRAWGASEAMPCPYGCRPAGGLLPAAVTRRLVDESKAPAAGRGEVRRG